MDHARWHRIEEIFHQATLESPGPGRDALVRSLCPDDDALATEVFTLLNEDDRLLAEAEQPDSRIGLRLGPYAIDSTVGRGGMATVYRAHRADDQFHQQVAIKVMDVRLSDPTLVAYFRTERQILAMLEHPALTRLLDGGVTAAGEPYLVMELVDGLPIDQHCDSHGLDVAARLRLFADVCDGVSFAHRNLVLHRDLKPSNILVTTDGHVKVVDFGTAKLLEPGLQATMSGAPLTPAYASPEQLKGQAVGTTSDQYSLGLVLFELLSGAAAFGDRQSLVSAVERAVSGVAPAPLATGVTGAAAAARKTRPRRSPACCRATWRRSWVRHWRTNRNGDMPACSTWPTTSSDGPPGSRSWRGRRAWPTACANWSHDTGSKWPRWWWRSSPWSAGCWRPSSRPVVPKMKQVEPRP